MSDGLGIRKAKRTLGSLILVLFLVVGVPYIIGQEIYEQWGGVGCLVPLLGCGGFIGLILSGAFAYNEDNGDTKISFEPPNRDKKSHEMAVSMVREMVGKQIRLVSVHWSDPGRDEYLYTPDIEYSDKRREVVSWMNEPTEDILSKSRYMVESVKGEEDQIRLASVHWSNLERYEYLYSSESGICPEPRLRQMLSWKDEVTEDILSKSRYIVEPVPGQEDEIRLASVHWSDPERYEYLITSRHQERQDRRDVYSWKREQPTNDILSKSRYRVVFVDFSKEEETEEENWWGGDQSLEID